MESHSEELRRNRGTYVLGSLTEDRKDSVHNCLQEASGPAKMRIQIYSTELQPVWPNGRVSLYPKALSFLGLLHWDPSSPDSVPPLTPLL